MKNVLLAAAAAVASLLSMPAHAQLSQGARAPVFSTQAAKAGKPFRFDLAEALRRGPVVLYFYPKAFTRGCTLEAHAFAEATDEFAAAGATVIGMSNDDLPTLQRFSTEACRDKFAVGIATPEIVRQYDVALQLPPEAAARAGGLGGSLTSRTSYVIAPDRRITLVYSNMDYRDHVKMTLDAVKALRTGRR
jgi:peroxiredoxin Q/BCP